MKSEKIKTYINTVDNWKFWKIIIAFPIFSGMAIYSSSPFIWLGQQNILENPEWKAFNWEFYLPLNNYALNILYLMFIILFLIIYFTSKRNKIFAMYMNNILITIMYTIFYYQMVIALQYFVQMRGVRYFGWMLFILSIPLILYMLFKGKSTKMQLLTPTSRKKILRLVGILWVVNMVISTIFEGIKEIKNIFWITIASFLPIALIVITILLYDDLFESLRFLKKVNQNQEKYRKECGYSVKDWYGSRSKEYLSKEIKD